MQALQPLHNLRQAETATPRPAPLSKGSEPTSAMGVPACFGVCCPRHHACAHYARVDGADPQDVFMDHCGPDFATFEALP